MAEHIKLNAFSINKIIDLIKGQDHGSVAYTLNEAETEVRVAGKFTDEYVGSCIRAEAGKIKCSAQLKVHMMKAGCDGGFSSDPEVVETKKIIFDDVSVPDALVGITDVGLSDATSPRADMSVAADAQVSNDGQVIVGDGQVIPQDASMVDEDGAVQPGADMSVAADEGVAADAAPVEPDAAVVPPPPLDLESITFGIDPGADNCFAIDPQETSACLDVQSVNAFDVSRLFHEEGQPDPVAIDGVQFALDANHSIPRDISTINRADRHRFTRLIPVDVASEDATWAIEVHDEFPQNPQDNTIEVVGNMSASLEHCVNGDCSQDSYTLHISISSNVNGALALCSWQYPKPEGSPCPR